MRDYKISSFSFETMSNQPNNLNDYPYIVR